MAFDAYDTTYEAVLGAIIACVKTAWSLTDQQVYVGEPEVPVTAAPIGHIMTPKVVGRASTPTNEEYELQWVISHAFEREAGVQTDVSRARKFTALQSELYGALNLGDYSYLGQLGGYEVVETTIEGAIALSVLFTCNITVLRSP